MADPLQLAQAARSYGDINNEHQLQLLQQGLLKTQGLSGANIYATQVLSGAVPGGQEAYDAARQHLAGQGIDVSNWAPDVQIGAQQAQAARLAQAPLFPLLNMATKFDTNNNAAAIAGGNIPSNPNAVAQALLSQGINAITPGASALFPQNPAAAIAPQIPQNSQMSAPAQAPTPVPAGTTDAAIGRFSNVSAPPIKEPGETLEAYKSRVELWKSDPGYQGAVEAAKVQGAEEVKQSAQAANAHETLGKLQENINGLRQIVQSGDMPQARFGIPAKNYAYLSQNFGGKQWAKAFNQWEQLGSAQSLNELQQLTNSGQIRGSQKLIGLIKEASTVPADASDESKMQLLDNINNELKNVSVSSANVAATTTGSPKQSYNPINTNSQAAPSIKNGMTATGPNGKRIIFVDGEWKNLN